MKPKISVIIPVYNVSKWLQCCLDSVVNQTLREIEIIIVNDASPDPQDDIICREYADKDPRITYIVHAHNKGLGSARNTGIDAASGEYLAFVDSDDWIEHNMYQLMYDAADNGTHVIVNCGVIEERKKSTITINTVTNEDGEVLNDLFISFVRYRIEDSLPSIPASAWNKIYQRAFINAHQLRFIEYYYWEEICFSYHLYYHAESMLCIPDCLYHYRQERDGAISNTISDKHLQSMRHLLQYLSAFHLEHPTTFDATGLPEKMLISLLFKRYLPRIADSGQYIPAIIDELVRGCDTTQTKKMMSEFCRFGFETHTCLLETHTRLGENYLYYSELERSVYSVKNAVKVISVRFKIYPLINFLYSIYRKLKNSSKVYTKLLELSLIFPNSTVSKKLRNSIVQRCIQAVIPLRSDFLLPMLQQHNKNYKLCQLTDRISQATTIETSSTISIMYAQCINPDAKYRCVTYTESPENPDLFIQWGSELRPNNLNFFINNPSKILFLEDAFVKSVHTGANVSIPFKTRTAGIAFILEDLCYHFNCYYPSQLEMRINSDMELTTEQQQYARVMLDKIISNHISKYNFQPIFTPTIGRFGVNKILIIDQSFGDQSIPASNSSPQLFTQMLAAAIDENPGADIIIKAHPDALVPGPRTGFYNIENTLDKYPNANLYLYTNEINPISILQYVNKVYVMSSGMGMEALMCGKEVVVFGCPFYAGWGLTDDRNSILRTKKLKNRRSRRRTLLELFYFSYIDYPVYMNLAEKRLCSLDEALDLLIAQRDAFFATTQDFAAHAEESVSPLALSRT